MPDICDAARRAETFLAVQSLHLRGVCVWLCLLLAVSRPVVAEDSSLITVENQIWGFDGRVIEGQFNPVSFLVDNRTDESLDVQAAFSRQEALVGATSGYYVQPVFLGPGARRWIQFQVYIAEGYQTEWELKLGDLRFPQVMQPRSVQSQLRDPKKKDRKRTPSQRVAVILDAPGRLDLQPTSVKHFPDEIFPPWSTATQGLDVVFLDHLPDWEAPRQQALMGWIRTGGQLHLLRDSRGEWPQLSGHLSDADQPFSRYSVGSGIVIRHEISRRDLSVEYVNQVLGVSADDQPEDPVETDIVDLSDAASYGAVVLDQQTTGWLDDAWFRTLRELSQPEHAWWAIFLLALVYIALLFPGCWLLARGGRSYLTVYGAIVGLSIVFSLIFLMIGRRGHGESTSLFTLAISRIDQQAEQHVMEWSALFVTDGDEYTISASDQQSLFAIPALRQRSNATMTAGNEGTLKVSIPPFSTQTFLCSRQQPPPPWTIQPFNEPDSNLTASVTLQYSDGFPEGQDVQVWVLRGNQLYRMQEDSENRLLRKSGTLGSVTTVCQKYLNNGYESLGWDAPADRKARDFWKSILHGLVLRHLLGDAAGRLDEYELPPNRIRVFVFAPVPEDRFVRTSTDRITHGRILYIQDLQLQDRAASPSDAVVPSGRLPNSTDVSD